MSDFVFVLVAWPILLGILSAISVPLVWNRLDRLPDWRHYSRLLRDKAMALRVAIVVGIILGLASLIAQIAILTAFDVFVGDQLYLYLFGVVPTAVLSCCGAYIGQLWILRKRGPD
jgi:hypothetical protein